MRILHLTEDFLPINGGLSRFCFDLLSEQIRSGDHVQVVTNAHTESIPPMESLHGITVRRVPCRFAIANNNPVLLKQATQEIASIKQNFRPDIIHIHCSGWFPWLHVLSLNAAPNVKTVVTLHTPPDGLTLPAPVTRRLLESADRVVAVSAATMESWNSRYDEPAEKSGAILNGIPILDHSTPPPIPLDPATLLCLGRLHDTKGFDVALKAFASLAHRWPTARLVIAGDGPARTELEELTAQLDLNARVIFSGWIGADQIATTIGAATLVLMPSRWAEPFGLVAIETALMGRPLIASQVGGLPEIVIEGETGRLVPPNNPQALASAIESLLVAPARIQQMGIAARKRAHQYFSMERCAADYAQLYNNLVRPISKGTL